MEESPLWRRVLVAVVKYTIVVVAVVLLVRLFHRIDWGKVGSALSSLTWCQVLVLLGLVALRITCSAGPLYFFVPGLGPRRALTCGLAAGVAATLMPSPSDLVLRQTMLKSWGIAPARAVSGAVLNTYVFYATRFAAPLLGLLLSALALQADSAYVGAAVGGSIVALLLVAGLVAVTRGSDVAASLGRRAGRTAHRFRRTVDEDRWSAAVLEFQQTSADGLARRSLEATLAIAGLLVVDGCIVAVSLRFLGLPSQAVSTVAVVAAFLCAYPLTIFPIQGLGVFDASLIGLLNAIDLTDTSLYVAAVVIWRVASLLVPLLPGVAALLVWRSERNRLDLDRSTT